jgi:hypothetical protein
MVGRASAPLLRTAVLPQRVERRILGTFKLAERSLNSYDCVVPRIAAALGVEVSELARRAEEIARS